MENYLAFIFEKLNLNTPYHAPETATLGKSSKKQGIKYHKEINLYCKGVSSTAIFSLCTCFVLETILST